MITDDYLAQHGIANISATMASTGAIRKTINPILGLGIITFTATVRL